MGIGDREYAAKLPRSKSKGVPDIFPWGTGPLPPKSENLSGTEATDKRVRGDQLILSDYRDDFPYTAPVGSFSPNRFGLFDLGGNVSEFCEDIWDTQNDSRIKRGASFKDGNRELFLSSFRNGLPHDSRDKDLGFRVVLAPVAAPAEKSASPAAATPAPAKPIPAATPHPTTTPAASTLAATSSGPAFRQAKPSKLPQLTALRVEHLHNAERLTAPLTAEYYRRLESLKQQFTREGKLKEAVAVDTEIKKGPASPDEPEELTQRRNEHLSAVQRAIAPLNSAYVQKLEAMKTQYTREGKLEVALIIDAELAEVRRQVLSNELALISASYGVIGSSLVADVTETIANAMNSGSPTVRLTAAGPGIFKTDPAPQKKKRTKITYSIKGFIKEKTFPEGYELNFKNDLD